MYKNDKRQNLVIYLKNSSGIFGELKYNKESFKSFAKHSHKSFNIIAIIGGKIDIEYHNQPLQALNSGELAIFNPNQVHLTSSKKPQCLDYYSIHLQMPWCIDILKELFGIEHFLNLSPNIITNTDIANKFLEICNSILNKKDVEQELRAFIKELFATYCQTSPQEQTNPILQRVESYILKHLQEPLTLEVVAKEVGYSTAHINRLFKAQYGLTLHAFLIDKRIDKAKELILQNKTATLTEIAYQAGFYDQSHFIKNFKKAYSLSPKAYK